MKHIKDLLLKDGWSIRSLNEFCVEILDDQGQDRACCLVPNVTVESIAKDLNEQLAYWKDQGNDQEAQAIIIDLTEAISKCQT